MSKAKFLIAILIAFSVAFMYSAPLAFSGPSISSGTGDGTFLLAAATKKKLKPRKKTKARPKKSVPSQATPRQSAPSNDYVPPSQAAPGQTKLEPLPLSASSQQGGGLALGVVDMGKAIDNSKEGKASNSKMKAKYESIKKKLDERRVALDEKARRLDADSKTLSPEEFEKRRKDLQKEVEALQTEADMAAGEMQKSADSFYGPLYAKAEKVVESIAKRQKLLAVVENTADKAVIWAVPNARFLDLTKEVTQGLDGN
jgi:Skp family chaperone for outer membrane proteins